MQKRTVVVHVYFARYQCEVTAVLNTKLTSGIEIAVRLTDSVLLMLYGLSYRSRYRLVAVVCLFGHAHAGWFLLVRSGAGSF